MTALLTIIRYGLLSRFGVPVSPRPHHKRAQLLLPSRKRARWVSRRATLLLCGLALVTIGAAPVPTTPPASATSHSATPPAGAPWHCSSSLAGTGGAADDLLELLLDHPDGYALTLKPRPDADGRRHLTILYWSKSETGERWLKQASAMVDGDSCAVSVVSPV